MNLAFFPSFFYVFFCFVLFLQWLLGVLLAQTLTLTRAWGCHQILKAFSASPSTSCCTVNVQTARVKSTDAINSSLISTQLHFMLKEFRVTPVVGGGDLLRTVAFLADWEKQFGSFEQCISFPCGKPVGALSGFNIGAIYTVLSVWAARNGAAARLTI